MKLIAEIVFSQGSSSGFAYDYNKTYIKKLETYYNNPKHAEYTLPQDSFVSADNPFKINGGTSSTFWVDSRTIDSGGRTSHTRTENTYVCFAFCKKGDILSIDYDGNSTHEYHSTLTIIPVRK